MTKKVVSLEEFNDLPILMQLNILQKDGVHIGKRRVKDQVVILFQIHGFYAEVYYKTYRKEVDQLLTSPDVDILQPYLDQIKVKGLEKPQQ
jgi:flagellar biosynthesis regulator FlbT